MLPRTRLRRFNLPTASASRPAFRHTPAAVSSLCRAPNSSYHTTSPAPLAGHHVLITGGSRGIGKAIASRLAALSASTTIVGRNPSTLLSATKEIASSASATPTAPSSEPSPTHGYVAGDISTKGFWEMLSRSLILRHTVVPSTASEKQQHPDPDPRAHKFDPTPLTILVNAAGVTHNALLVRQTASAAEDVVQTNLMGTVWGCKVLGKVLIGNARRKKDVRGGLSIANVSSLLAVQGGVGSAAYAASKAGVLGLTRALAGEMGPLGVRVNAILPGYVETDMTAAMQTEAREKALERIPLKRFGTVEEIADAAVFLATNQYANNCVINLDGGLSAVSARSRHNPFFSPVSCYSKTPYARVV